MDFPIIDVSQWEQDRDEATGSSPKIWLRDPNGELWLFKSPKRANPLSGDDWAEKIAAECYAIVGVPHANVELASRHQGGQLTQGVISQDVRPELPRVNPSDRKSHESLVLGNEFLAECVKSYPREAGKPGDFYRVDVVMDALQNAAPPVGVSNQSACDVFIGFMLMDLLLLSTDRNHSNWGVTRIPNQKVKLAPSFDHGSSLGWQLNDNGRELGLRDSNSRFAPSRFAQSGQCMFIAHKGTTKRATLADAFLTSARYNKTAAHEWVTKVRSITSHSFVELTTRVPEQRMSSVAKKHVAGLFDASLRQIELAEQKLSGE